MDIERMREDWRIARAWLRQAEDWPEAELDAVWDALRQAVAAGDEGLLASWAAWLALWAGVAMAAARRCREAEERMRIRVRAEREQAKGRR